jgi:hypothetical protein
MEAPRDTLGSLGFKLRKGYVHPDRRGRLTLGSAASHPDYRVLVNDRGQILLDPVVAVPASEAWRWQNEALRVSMDRALRQAEAGEFTELGSFAEFADAEE